MLIDAASSSGASVNATGADRLRRANRMISAASNTPAPPATRIHIVLLLEFDFAGTGAVAAAVACATATFAFHEPRLSLSRLSLTPRYKSPSRCNVMVRVSPISNGVPCLPTRPISDQHAMPGAGQPPRSCAAASHCAPHGTPVGGTDELGRLP